MGNREDLEALAGALNAREHGAIVRRALDLADSCDRVGLLDARPLPLRDLLTAIADYVLAVESWRAGAGEPSRIVARTVVDVGAVRSEPRAARVGEPLHPAFPTIGEMVDPCATCGHARSAHGSDGCRWERIFPTAPRCGCVHYIEAGEAPAATMAIAAIAVEPFATFVVEVTRGAFRTPVRVGARTVMLDTLSPAEQAAWAWRWFSEGRRPYRVVLDATEDEHAGRGVVLGRGKSNDEESTVRAVVDVAGDLFLYVDEASGGALVICPASTAELTALRAMLAEHLDVIERGH